MMFFNREYEEDATCDCGYMTPSGCVTNPTPFCHVRHPGDWETWWALGELAGQQGLLAEEALEILKPDAPISAEREPFLRGKTYVDPNPPPHYYWMDCPYPDSDPRREGWMLSHEPYEDDPHD